MYIKPQQNICLGKEVGNYLITSSLTSSNSNIPHLYFSSLIRDWRTKTWMSMSGWRGWSSLMEKSFVRKTPTQTKRRPVLSNDATHDIYNNSQHIHHLHICAPFIVHWFHSSTIQHLVLPVYSYNQGNLSSFIIRMSWITVVWCDTHFYYR